MSLIFTKFVLPWNTTTSTTTIAAIVTTTTTTTTTTSSFSAATNISDSLREEAMDVVVAKIISLLILTILSVLCGLLPLRLLIHMPHLFTRSRGSVDYFLCGLRLFSGGIYLATCFLHLMPDTREKMAAVMLNMGSRTTYAVPELLVMSGFYAVVFVEQIIQALYVKAQESDLRRKKRKANKPKPDKEHKKPVPVFRSTLDDDVGHMGNPGDRRGFGYDEDDDDDDDNVLIDDEDDLSFNDDSDSDRKSLDSATQVKENLIDQLPTSNKTGTQRSGQQHFQLIPTHSQPTRNSQFQSEILPHSNACSFDTGTRVLRTFGRPPLDGLMLSGQNDIRPYQNSGPPVMGMHARQLHSSQQSLKQLQIQQANQKPQHQEEQQQKQINRHSQPLQLPNHHIHFHDKPKPLPAHQQQHHDASHQEQRQQNEQQQQQQQQQQQRQTEKTVTSDSPQNLQGQQQQQTQQEQQQQQPQHQQQPPKALQQSSPPHDSPKAKVGVQYPSISPCPRDESDDEPEVCLSNNTCRVAVCVEGGRPSSVAGDSITKINTDANQDKDVDSGVFSTRRDNETTESGSRKFGQSTSRDVSFDRISESSSVLPDIQVKRVVDELSRTDDSSRAHFRSIIYIMALSFHGIFEGMALGLQSMKSSVWALCFAIVVHRCVLAFKLGMDLCRGEERQGTAFLCIGTFTLISTLGIIIGILISSGASLYSDVTVPEAILQSLATGTIFYIVFFDILFKDLEGKEDLKRVSSSFVGFSLMAIVFAITRS